MDQTITPAPPHAARARIGWPFPKWGLIAGLAFVALMATPLGAMPGFVMIWIIILAAAPFMIAATLIGGATASYIAGALALTIYVLAPVALSIRAILWAPDRTCRARLLNRFVLLLLLLVGMAVSVRSLSEAWP